MMMKNKTFAKKLSYAILIVIQSFVYNVVSVAQEQLLPDQAGEVKEFKTILPFTDEQVSIEVEVINGQAILEGDIFINLPESMNTDLSDISSISSEKIEPDRAGAIITGSKYRWLDNKIPYIITSGNPKSDDINKAIKYWNQNTDIKLVQRSSEKDYIEFVYVKDNGCGSYIGKQGGKQKIDCDCSAWGSIDHEIGHAAGLFHEHSRQDRDKYITIVWKNITPEKEKYNFNVYTKSGYSGMDLYSYDYNSIMHYSATAFGNGKTTITSNMAGKMFGQRDSLSKGDKKALSMIYTASGILNALSDAADIKPDGINSASATASQISSDEIKAMGFKIDYKVELVPQMTGVSCWAAGAAMIVGWRDKVCINPEEIAKGIGYWKQYYMPNGGLPADDTKMFAYWGLTPLQPMSYTVEGFRNILASYGPLWCASAEPGSHIRVVAGMSGDGTPDGTLLTIYDPWDKNMKAFVTGNKGSIYTETYTEFVKKQETLAEKEKNIPGAIYIAHP